MSGGMRTPLRRVLGLGSAKDGTMHFWTLRITSFALVPLTLFAVGLVFSLIGSDFEAARIVLAQPLIAIALILFIVISVEHMRLGMQEVIADYIHGELLKIFTLMLNTAFSLIVGAASVFALLKIAFGA
ncbi:MAG TPA: succinate dehydrogenase, hydrophobic membrane anchor protein [Rhizobiaceae bacterium]|nr:succinate dehydrogenase, hydrophobic membrane anchor protein [Rhizobiaceae bacterium]